MTYGLGFKELWLIDKSKHTPGYVEHTIGYPLVGLNFYSNIFVVKDILRTNLKIVIYTMFSRIFKAMVDRSCITSKTMVSLLFLSAL